jgi:hypothetical protein
MAKALVKADMHILLFTMLYRESCSEEEVESPRRGTLSHSYSPPYANEEEEDRIKECE